MNVSIKESKDKTKKDLVTIEFDSEENVFALVEDADGPTERTLNDVVKVYLTKDQWEELIRMKPVYCGIVDHSQIFLNQRD